LNFRDVLEPLIRAVRPNKRLKLTGPASEEASVCAPTSSYLRAGRLRPPAFAPQLKRDPLGGASVHPRLRNVLWGLQWGILCAAGLAIGALRAALKDPQGFGIHHTAILKFVLAATGLCLLAGSVLGFFRPFARSVLEYLFIAALAGYSSSVRCFFSVNSLIPQLL